MAEITESTHASRQASVKRPNVVFEFFYRLFREKPLGAAGAVVCLIFLFAGIFADLLAPYGYNHIMLIHRMKPPSGQFWFGTDNLGRDILSRVIYGARLSVIIGFSAATLATLISIVLGATTGYLGGRFDMLVQRFVDAWMSFPDLVVLIVVVAVAGPGMLSVIVTLGCFFGIAGSRIVRSAVLSVCEQTYIHAAQSIGCGTNRILWRHILPNVMPSVIVLFTTRVGAAILAEASLSFLGFGVPPPAPSWGGMLTGSSRNYMYLAPWMALAPGICLTLVVFSINMFGDALRDLLDPRMRGHR
ncbi:ABC transporter permease [Bradyrhizobium cosmicum]|uniref:ABC transporter permease n=1 Tax=Bradyrhizobium cosmicum TaxID=1404864 RepID=UPI0028EB01CF|nr:ABC transporter permease [Bradyrhizobium cosmicum]